MAVKAIIFDIDGVLADSREAVVQNTISLLAEFGQNVPPEKVRGMSTAHSADSVLIALVPTLSQDRELLAKMLRRLSVITQKNLFIVKPTQLARAVPELAKKYYLAAASNRKSSAIPVLEMLGIADRFVAIVTSADAPAKPDPGMINLALAKLHVKPSEAIFIGDNEEDRMAGEAAGVRTIMIDGTKEEECRKLLRELA
ncbi:MAG: HAD family hydrolase [Candidatus Micrarchaeia archaeon]